MGIFYHVDHAGALSAGQILALTPPVFSRADSSMAEYFDRYAFEGLSQHGQQYLGKRGGIYGDTLDQEFVLEQVRAEIRPNAVSRFQAVFAWERQADAQTFAREYPMTTATIWQVQAESSFRGDMRAFQNNGLRWRAMRYWSGEEVGDPRGPLWEHLLVPPVTVIRRAPMPAL